MYKKVNVAMLPTNEKAIEGNIGLNESDNFLQIMQRRYLGNKFFETEDGSPAHGIVIPQHLYITSDENIKEGDWCILDLGENTRIVQIKSLNSGHSIFTIDIIDGYAQLSNLKKIIATTDASLGLLEVGKAGYSTEEFYSILPLISQQFIQYYIEEYNKGNVITEVEVEYFIDYEPGNKLCDRKYDIECLKINPDNTINIKPIKDSWTKNDTKLIKAFQDFACAVYDENYKSDMSFRKRAEIMSVKWIKENL